VISTFTPPAHSEGMRPGTSSGPLHAPVPMPNGRRSEPPPLLMSLKSGPSKSARTPSCTKINHRHIGPLRTAERYAAGRPGLCGADNSKGTDYPELPSEVWPISRATSMRTGPAATPQPWRLISFRRNARAS